jgi:hypothetical protein
MANDPKTRVAGKHTLKFLVRFARAVRDDHHSSVKRVTNPDAAPVVNGHPRRAG